MEKTEFESKLGELAETAKEGFKTIYTKRFKGTDLATNYDFLAVVVKSIKLVGTEETEKILEGIFKDNVPQKIAATWFKTKVELDEANRGVKKTLFVLVASTPRKYVKDAKDHFVANFNFVMDDKLYITPVFDEDTEITRRVQPFKSYEVDVLLRDGKFDGFPDHFSVIPVDKDIEPDYMRQLVVTQFTNFQPPVTADMAEGGSFYFIGKVLAKMDRVGRTSFTIGLEDGNSAEEQKITASVESNIGRVIDNFDMVIGTLSVALDRATSTPRTYTDFLFPLKKIKQETLFPTNFETPTTAATPMMAGNGFKSDDGGIDDIFGN